MRYYAAYALIVALALAFNLVARRWTLSPRLHLVGNAVFAAMLAGLMWSVSEPLNFLSDFHKAYYPAGQAVTTDADLLYPGPGAELTFVNVPIVAWLFVPFSWMSGDAAGIVITALGVGAVVAAFAGMTLLAALQGWQRAALAALFVANGPLYNSLREGNLTHFILGLLVVAIWCMDTRRDGWLGGILAVAGVLKPPLFLLAVPFLLRRNRRFAIGFGATLAAVAAVSLAAFGIDLHVTWYERTVEPFTRHPLGAFNVQSVDGFLARLLGGAGHLTSWQPIAEFRTGFLAARITAAMVLAGVTAWIFRASRPAAGRDGLRLEFATVLCLALIIGPISWTHYYLLMLLCAALFLGGRLALPAGPRWSAVVWAGIALISPPVVVPNTSHPIVGPVIARVLMSHYFFGGLTLLAVFLAARWHNGRHQERQEAAALDTGASQAA